MTYTYDELLKFIGDEYYDSRTKVRFKIVVDTLLHVLVNFQWINPYELLFHMDFLNNGIFKVKYILANERGVVTYVMDLKGETVDKRYFIMEISNVRE